MLTQTQTLFTGAKFLLEDGRYATGITVCNGKIDRVFEGDANAPVKDIQEANIVDLGGRIVLPAFVDTHCHILPLGQSLKKVDLMGCKSLADICSRLSDFEKENSDAESILARNWIPDMTLPEEIDRRSFDVFAKPVYLESFDLHSMILNSAAMTELGIAEDMQSPSGGEVVRDESGRITGWFKEMAHLGIIHPALEKKGTMESKRRFVKDAFSALLTAGYTGVADLLMMEEPFAILEEMMNERGGTLPMRVRVYWLVTSEEKLEDSFKHVERAKELQQKWKGNEWLQVNGIKLVSDGVIDSCTASMLEQYRNGTNAEPIWAQDRLTAVVQKADSLDLQCAIHAIGDRSVRMCVDALASLGRERIVANRHRIEHLEMTAAADGDRIGELGITCSVQPVHSDPAILPNWYDQLGGKDADRCCRAFAYKHFLEAGAPLAIGTDAPTAPHFPLPNLHIATTRRSAQDPELTEQTTPQYALPLLTAVLAATKGAAQACHLDKLQGQFRPGASADFNILDVDIFTKENNILLKAKVSETYFRGKLVAKNDALLDPIV